MLAAIQRQLPEHKDIVYTGRYLSDEATVLGAIRCYVSGEVHRWNDLRYAAERLLEDVAFPLRTATARESAMVERLLEESAQDRPWGRDRNADHALELLTERKGIGWLFTPAAAPTGVSRRLTATCRPPWRRSRLSCSPPATPAATTASPGGSAPLRCRWQRPSPLRSPTRRSTGMRRSRRSRSLPIYRPSWTRTPPR
ncbi:hypothetical protein ACFQ0M_48395 [Kitasatospora aburaviensis]